MNFVYMYKQEAFKIQINIIFQSFLQKRTKIKKLITFFYVIQFINF